MGRRGRRGSLVSIPEHHEISVLADNALWQGQLRHGKERDKDRISKLLGYWRLK